MKPRILTLLVLLAWISPGIAFNWGEYYLTQPKLNITEDKVILIPGGIDSQQPDTIFYDDDNPTTLLTGGSTIWADTRFTAPVEFDLISVYIYPLNQNNNQTDNMTIYVAADDGSGLPIAPLLASMTVPAPIPPYPEWIDVDLPDTVTIAEGEDFHIMYNCPMGAYPGGTGWWPFFDNASSANRSKYANTPTATTWNNMPGDLIIRAGGILSGGFVDLSTDAVYNTDGNFFFWPEDQVVFAANVDNLGAIDVDVYVFMWEVEDESGAVIWSFEDIFAGLTAGDSTSVTCSEIWEPEEEGVYTVIGTVIHPDDADPNNDINYLEQMIVVYDLDNPVWLSYDDGISETNFNFSDGDEFGISFSPPVFAVIIDSISLSFGSGALCNIKIYQNDGFGNTPSTELWSTSATTVAGWNHFVPDVDVFNDGFSIVVEPQAAISIQMDEDPPQAGTNNGMPVVAWQYGAGGWEDFGRGDMMIRAKIRESDATPQEAILEVSLDSVNFGTVAVGSIAEIDFTMYNTGSVDPLQITSINFTNPVVYSTVGFSPITQIPAGDSLVIQIIFEPQAVSSYPGQIGILHNSPISPFPFFLPITGEGIQGASGWVLEITATGEEGTAPNEFSVIIGGDDEENFLPAPPPPPQYMCWPQLWQLPEWNGPYGEMIQIWDESNEYEWTLEIDPNGNVMPPESRTTVLTWDPASLPETPENWGFFLMDDYGNIVVADMSQQSAYDVTGAANTFLHLKYGQLIAPFTYYLPSYWSLISLPVIPEDNGLAVLFPNATVAYEFTGGTYVQADSLDNGKAYWLYVPDADSVTVTGMPFTQYTIPVNPPWEMLGSVSTPAIPTVDPGSIVVIYNFDQTYYQVPDLVMEPGFGYWVNMTGDVEEFSLNGGTLIDGSVKFEEAEEKIASLDNWELTLNLNGDASSFTLTIGNGEIADYTPAPPAPPQYSVWGELYETDWSSGPYFRMIQPAGSDISVWLINIDPNGNAAPPVAGTTLLSWDTESIPTQGLLSLINESGDILVEDMRTVESLEIIGTESSHFEILFSTTLGIGSSESPVPADYTLYQNTPNPFNPVTRIKYYLPEAGKVTITVFNIMGEEVAQLADGLKSPGYHTVNFNAERLTSGVYFYRLETDAVTDMKKMVFLK